MSPTRLDLFIPDLRMGGAERVFVTLARLLARRGHRPRLILAEKSGPLLGELPAEIERIDLASLKNGHADWRSAWRTIQALAWHLRTDPPDTLLTTLTGANLCAVLAWRLAGRPCRLVLRAAAPLANSRSPWRRLLMRALYPQADALIVLNAHMQQELRAMGLPAEKLHVLVNPIDTEYLTARASAVSPAPQAAPYLLAIGRLAEPKDFATLIEAFVQMRRHRQIELRILGDGPLRPALENRIAALGLGARVHLMGLTENPYPWLQHARAFVLSSRWEGCPNVLLEARHFGLPLLVTAYDPSVRDFLAGLREDRYRLVAVADPQSMAAALDALLDVPATPEDLPGVPQTGIEAYETLLTRPHARR